MMEEIEKLFQEFCKSLEEQDLQKAAELFAIHLTESKGNNSAFFEAIGDDSAVVVGLGANVQRALVEAKPEVMPGFKTNSLYDQQKNIQFLIHSFFHG